MTDIFSIIQNGSANLKLEVTGEDLLIFSNNLINRAKDELSSMIAEARKERFLSKEEVKKLCGVCDATLWHWGKRNYLKPIKVGNKVRYRYSDVQKILGEKQFDV
ncbi:transcriptional regulator, AlpA family [Segatella baroniae F0067]|uniref:Transcriptional regulator, AlpA family n=1 Tax=Segatella baroniae F0067 TaxID=1115809 RepID=U2QK29_9BACT|nr:helix-turn-helix domain-containing protein [Segatella baroniae]ERK39172.1 transcriptional regulator, AlpA family [Segatella baroniae F0067]